VCPDVEKYISLLQKAAEVANAGIVAILFIIDRHVAIIEVDDETDPRINGAYEFFFFTEAKVEDWSSRWRVRILACDIISMAEDQQQS